MKRYLQTRNLRMLEEELPTPLSEKPLDFATRPKLVSLSAQGLPEASAMAQALRQGEEAVDGRWVAARERGAEFLQQSFDGRVPADVFSTNVAQPRAAKLEVAAVGDLT